MDGFLLVDKEKGYTSFDVCNKLKHKFKLKKVGHNGTLDPNATGLMIVAVNSATKLLNNLNCNDKQYIATILFGKESNTLDSEGEILKDEKNIEITENDIDNVLNILKDQEQQIPPMFSAIKVNGKKLCDLARKNITLDLQPRSIKIYNLQRLTDIYLSEDNYKKVDILLTVSKGFYVRSFVRDMCELLKIPGLLQDLRRTKNGDYDIKNAKKIDEINESDIFQLTII